MDFKNKLSYRQWVFKLNLLVEKLFYLCVVVIITGWIVIFTYIYEGGFIVYEKNKYGDYEGHIASVYFYLLIIYFIVFRMLLKDGYKSYCEDFDYWHEVKYGDKKWYDVYYGDKNKKGE